MLISELAKKTHLTTHTIRFYEQEGLLDHRHVQRGKNNYRYYTEEAMERLMLIKKVQKIGFTLSDFSLLVKDYDVGQLTNQKQIDFLQNKIDTISKDIHDLKQVRTYLSQKLNRLYEKENGEPSDKNP